MYSAFVLRDFGFGHPLTGHQLDHVNRFREGKNYLDEDAMRTINNNNPTKSPLTTTSLFVWKVDQYGQNQDGYWWSYDTMVLQFEDCIDTIQAILYGNCYDSAWYFDHSTGHDKLCPDGLNRHNMNKSFGGAVKKMRDTTIHNATYLGPAYILISLLKCRLQPIF